MGLGPKVKKPRGYKTVKVSSPSKKPKASTSDSSSSDEDDAAQTSYTPSDRLNHKVRTSVRRSVKKSLSLELRKISKRIKDSFTSAAKTSALSDQVLTKGLPKEVICRVIERRLGMGYKGIGNDPLENHLLTISDSGVRTRTKDTCERLIKSSCVREIMDSGNEELVRMRRREMGDGGRGKKRKKGQVDRMATKGEWSKGYEGQQGVFLTLNGDAEEEGEGGAGEGGNPYGPGGNEVDEWGEVVKVGKKNRKGQRARQAKARAKEARKRGEKWDSSVNWRKPKDRTEEGGQGKGERRRGEVGGRGGEGGKVKGR